MMRTAQRDFALLYFENQAERPVLAGFEPGRRYRWTWFDPRSGEWISGEAVQADGSGHIATPPMPAGGAGMANDWAAKLRREP